MMMCKMLIFTHVTCISAHQYFCTFSNFSISIHTWRWGLPQIPGITSSFSHQGAHCPYQQQDGLGQLHQTTTHLDWLPSSAHAEQYWKGSKTIGMDLVSVNSTSVIPCVYSLLWWAYITWLAVNVKHGHVRWNTYPRRMIWILFFFAIYIFGHIKNAMGPHWLYLCRLNLFTYISLYSGTVYSLQPLA